MIDSLPQETSLLLYENDDGSLHIDACLYDETVWLTQMQMAEIFDRERSVIAKHIGNVFSEGELEEKSVCAKFATTTAHVEHDTVSCLSEQSGDVEGD